MGHRRRSWFVMGMMWFGFVFFYAPMLVLVVYSFNKSQIATVWGGFSFRWYVEMFHNETLLAAAWRSLYVAITSSTIATLIGTIAGIVLARLRRFRGRLLLGGMTTAPMVVPETITGLQMLLLFLAMAALVGWPANRGTMTVTIAHATFAISYVTIIVQAQLSGMEKEVEEAALDLGAKPMEVLWDVTLPLIAPAMISGWLLSFVLSLDDVVLASFTSGPGATTLPLLIYSEVRRGVSPDINALGALLLGVVTLVGGIVFWLTVRVENRRQRDINLALSVIATGQEAIQMRRASITRLPPRHHPADRKLMME